MTHSRTNGVAMLNHNFSYESALTDALKVTWKVEDLIGGDKTLDFSRPFLPDALAGVKRIECLDEREKLVLNQIRGNSYLYLFGFVEEFILPFVLDQARAAVHKDAVEVRALTTFAEEEAKHIHLFLRFAEEFKRGFGVECGVIGPAADVAKVVLSHSTLGVALLTLHLEWMTQAHYLESVKDEADLDPQFKSLLRHHWMEEAQHAKLDTLLVDSLADAVGAEGIAKGFQDFAALGTAIDGLLETQGKLDIESLSRKTGRTFTEAEKAEITAVQRKSYRYTFLVSGLEHPSFKRSVAELSPAAAVACEEMARALSS
jgi:hypothetical protein